MNLPATKPTSLTVQTTFRAHTGPILDLLVGKGAREDTKAMLKEVIQKAVVRAREREQRSSPPGPIDVDVQEGAEQTIDFMIEPLSQLDDSASLEDVGSCLSGVQRRKLKLALETVPGNACVPASSNNPQLAVPTARTFHNSQLTAFTPPLCVAVAPSKWLSSSMALIGTSSMLSTCWRMRFNWDVAHIVLVFL